MHIGARIKQKREEIGWSQRELAKRVGYTNNSTLAKIEQGKVDVCYEKLIQFSKALGVSILYLVGDDHINKEDAEFITSLGYLHPKEELPPEIEAVNTLLNSHGLYIMKTHGDYYFDDAGQVTEEELNDFLNTVTTMVNSAAHTFIKKKLQQNMRDFFNKE